MTKLVFEELQQELDPQLVDLLSKLQESGTPELYTLNPSQARETYARGARLLSGVPPAIDRYVDDQIETDERAMPVRLYFPLDDAGESLLIYFHGGGWSFGSIETHDNICRGGGVSWPWT